MVLYGQFPSSFLNCAVWPCSYLALRVDLISSVCCTKKQASVCMLLRRQLNLTLHSPRSFFPALTLHTAVMDHFIGQLATIGDRFSDYTITLSGGETFNTHRIVLYLHSPVFAAFLDKKSKDKEEDEISINYLEDEDPDAFRAMLHFFYHNSYDAPDSASALVLHVAVHHIAEVGLQIEYRSSTYLLTHLL